jgi:imidazolonepropionase-like amidohydrolase
MHSGFDLSVIFGHCLISGDRASEGAYGTGKCSGAAKESIMSQTIIRDCRVWDGSGNATFPADLLIEGGRIRAVSRNRGQLDGGSAEVIEVRAMTVMPGLVEGHAHLSFGNAVASTDLGDLPPEEHTLLTARNAMALLDHGFTSAYSAASAKLRLDIVIRNAIAAGQIPGPRLKACGPEITVTGGLGDERSVHMYRESFAVIADGPAEIVKWARLCCREGADSIKLNVSGDNLYKAAQAEMTVMSESEIRAGVEVAHDFHRKVNCHCRAAESVKRAVRCGVDVIYHCEHTDSEALDLLEGEKHRVFVGPAIGLPYAVRESLTASRSAADQKLRETVERSLAATVRTYEQMRKRGIRVVIGGDYGFDVTPQGANARDLEHFVKLFGYSPSEALVCATRVGAELMEMGDQLGQVREGYLADLLLVDGDPLADVSILQRQERLVAIMQNGKFHKLDREALARRQARSAA